MVCKVYQMYKKISGEDAVEREEKVCNTEYDVNRYIERMRKKYAKGCSCVVVEEYDDNGNYIISHCVW